MPSTSFALYYHYSTVYLVQQRGHQILWVSVSVPVRHAGQPCRDIPGFASHDRDPDIVTGQPPISGPECRTLISTAFECLKNRKSVFPILISDEKIIIHEKRNKVSQFRILEGRIGLPVEGCNSRNNDIFESECLFGLGQGLDRSH